MTNSVFKHNPNLLLGLATYLLLLIGLSFVSTSCKKELFYSKDHLSFSKDTVVFDTVFTTIGSTTQQLKIYNNDKNTLKIEEVELMGGENSPYRINLDGLQGAYFSNLEIETKDSLFLFVEVTLDPNGGVLPIVVEDSIRFRTNGKDQYVILAAWGQDMYYHFSDLDGPSTNWNYNDGIWNNDKPHVIYGAAIIGENKQLIIPAGTQIYMHKNASIYVYKGTLNIEGELNNEVVIQGDRLESEYDDVSGQYYGVYFYQAKPATINHAIIKNGTAGIHIESDGNNGSTPTVTITNSRIFNHARYGIINFHGGKVKAVNSVLYNNQFHSFINLAGASFDFNHCTFDGFVGGQEKLPAIGISDYYNDGQSTYVVDVTGTIKNSVIFGQQESELAFNLDQIGSNTFSIDHCLIKMDAPGTESFYNEIIWNDDPQFKADEDYKYLMWWTSPLINAGISTNVNLDIKEIQRDANPDIGAHEFN